VSFYTRSVLVWIKFKILNEERLHAAPKTAQFALLQEFTQFLRSYLLKAETQWSQQKNDFMLG
jgi:hypothetical protein